VFSDAVALTMTTMSMMAPFLLLYLSIVSAVSADWLQLA
jgi:hypothetical protein